MTQRKNETRTLALLLALLSLSGASSLPCRAADPQAATLLQSSDRARGGLLKGLEWEVELASQEDGSGSQRSFAVKARSDDALVSAVAPARNKGEVFLFNDRDMWFLKPGLRKPVAISARQRLSGQAANGDIASTHYARDYDGKVVGRVLLGGQPAYVLDLKSRDRKSTYDRIRYYIDGRSQLAVKAEFLTLQGAVFKTATFEYGNRIRSGGRDEPFVSRMTIVDARNVANRSVITYVRPRERELPASIFNINNVAR